MFDIKEIQSKYNEYAITANNVNSVVDLNKYFIINPFVSFGGWKTVPMIEEMIMMGHTHSVFNYKQRKVTRSKIVHRTCDLEIVDMNHFKSEAEKVKGDVIQYIGDGEIITEISWCLDEDIAKYKKRVINEIRRGVTYYVGGSCTRFSLTDMCEADAREFTALIINNAKVILEYLETTL